MRTTALLLTLTACPPATEAGPPPPEEIRCPDGAEAVGNACVDIDECATDNGGCGDPSVWRCENQVSAPPQCSYDPTADLDALTKGVGPLAYGGGLSSRMVVWGETAFPIAWTEDEAIVAAAARVGSGRVLHVGHEGQLSGGLEGGGAGALVRNAITWMSGSTKPVIGVYPGMNATKAWLENEGFEVRTVDATGIADVDIWFTTTYDDHDPSTDAAIRAWVTNGGGIIAGGHAWWWAYSTGSTDPFNDHPGNQWLGVAGLTLSGTSAGSAEVPVADAVAPLLHAGVALDAAAAHVAGSAPLPTDEAVRAAGAAGFAASVLHIDSPWFMTARSVLDTTPPVVPSEASPVVPAEQPISALVVRIASALAARLPATELDKHPAADDFPGAVAATEARETLSATVSASYAGRDSRYLYSGAGAPVWRSTGAWVPAGEPVTVTVPTAVVDSGIDLLVGAHTDRLWNTKNWTRMPEITRSWPIESTSTTVASAFGGPLYVRVPAGVNLGDIEVSASGVVAMPHFVLGRDTDASWPQEGGAPWGEIASDSLVLTVPAADVQAVESPESLGAFWQSVMDAQATLAAIDPERVRPERIVTDRQISVGWMHSGYPIMAHNASSGDFVTLSKLQASGDWGAFHELGHNHQWRDWLLPGTTEASCNLWSVHTMEEVVGIDRAEGHPALAPEKRAARIQAYIDGGRNFNADWSVWTALETWLQLQEAFGWDPLIEVQQQYLADPPGADPGDGAGRVNRWALRMSEATERDLSDFFLAWGLPLTEATRTEMAAWPAWSEHPMR